MPYLTTFFPHLKGFRLLAIERNTERVVLVCQRVTRSASCPLCGTPARRIHSRYLRTVWDLPIQQTAVVLRLQVHKFYCDTADCPRRIFTERIPDITPPHGRYTQRLREMLGQISQQQGGEAGARIAHLLGIPTCGRTLLRLLHARPLPTITPPTVVGIDDWAWKKRQRYGAVIVDLERRRPIALLPERSVALIRDWLTAHPTITLVARDRSKEFAAAITQALPHAQQVADRWHLAHNLTELLDKVIAARWKHIMPGLREPPVPSAAVVDMRTARRAVGDERYQQVLALDQAGELQEDIARRLGIGRRTVHRWLSPEHGPYAKPRKSHRRSLDQEWVLAYLRERWEAGEHDGTVLWKELRAQGYQGSVRSVYRHLAVWRPRYQRRIAAHNQLPLPPRSLWENLAPSRVVGWIIARPETLALRDQQRLAALCEADPSIY